MDSILYGFGDYIDNEEDGFRFFHHTIIAQKNKNTKNMKDSRESCERKEMAK